MALLCAFTNKHTNCIYSKESNKINTPAVSTFEGFEFSKNPLMELSTQPIIWLLLSAIIYQETVQYVFCLNTDTWHII